MLPTWMDISARWMLATIVFAVPLQIYAQESPFIGTLLTVIVTGFLLFYCVDWLIEAKR